VIVVRSGQDKVRAEVARQASTWFVANLAGMPDQAERADFVAWLKSSPIHVEEYLGVALVAHHLHAAASDAQEPLDSLIERARGDRTDDVVPLEASTPARVSAAKRILAPQGWSFSGPIAAVAILLAAAVAWWARDGEFLRLPKAYRTARGEQFAVSLPDGTGLRLNTDSAVTIRYDRHERIVELERGQALFTVARDGDRRFRVAIGQVDVVAVGTRFESYRMTDATSVTVIEGAVDVHAGQPPRPGATKPAPGAVRLAAGYQVQVDAGGRVAQPVAVDVQRTLAWLHGKIAFEQRPLAEVADEFNRYGSIPIEIDDPALRALPISGVFSADETDSFVAFLQTIDGVRVEKTPAQLRVYRVKSPQG
jgi:transmembrane sensor